MTEDDFERELYQIAIHEAGHVMVAWSQGWDIEYASISAEMDSNGRTVIIPSVRGGWNEDVTPIIAHCRSLEKRIRICFAGPIAEGRFAGNATHLVAAHSDFQDGVMLLRNVADTYEEREQIGDFLFEQTRKLVRRRWKEINLLATKLVANGELVSEEIEAVVGPRRMEFLSRTSSRQTLEFM